MICFLTSSPMIPETEILNPANGFAQELLASLPSPCRVLFVCSDPESFDQTDFFGASMRRSLEEAGLRISRFRILDNRWRSRAAGLIRNADLIILAGGHVPTQNRFFARIGMKKLLRGFDGVLMGISAGTMNSAELVYAQPEEEGETFDPEYQRFVPGLGLTKKMVLPHYQMIRDAVLDGQRVIEDISFGDSWGREFYVFPDGTYLYIADGREEIRGEAWLIKDGEMTPISEGF